jgi:hypothetical protein
MALLHNTGRNVGTGYRIVASVALYDIPNDGDRVPYISTADKPLAIEVSEDRGGLLRGQQRSNLSLIGDFEKFFERPFSCDGVRPGASPRTTGISWHISGVQ